MRKDIFKTLSIVGVLLSLVFVPLEGKTHAGDSTISVQTDKSEMSVQTDKSEMFIQTDKSEFFCGYCHILTYPRVLKKAYTSWKAGKHKNVGCVECHYPP
jgi:hypothetical protein